MKEQLVEIGINAELLNELSDSDSDFDRKDFIYENMT